MTKTLQRDFVAVVVAAGSSRRFGGGVPKQFLRLGGRTLLERSIDALVGHPAVQGAIVVLAPDEVEGERAEALRRRKGVLAVVAGGQVRSESVLRGIHAARTPCVLVHDAARPFASPALVDSVVQATREHGAAVPLLDVVDTVKRREDGWVRETLDRTRLGLAQTPQGFKVDWLVPALERCRREGLAPTDEAAALEHAGRRVATVPGDPGNSKITTQQDFEVTRRRLEGDTVQLRIGSGFDIHRAGDPERALVLGGVEFEGQPGLIGHSDADVVLHAVMDAVLGGAAMGDIGLHFPPEDPSFRGADSRELTRQVASMIARAGFEIVNVDITLLAEAPKIRPRSRAMRESIASCLGVGIDAIGLKATTLEGLGALGRGEGAACQAVALLRRADGA